MSTTLEPGYVIQDTYRLHSVLGEGGMGQTFRAVNIPLGHDVAIKVLSNPSYGEKGKQLFLREAQLLRGIAHPGVVRLETVLMGQNERLYIVMEYLTGHSLSYFINNGARLQTEDALKLGLRMAGALQAVHDQGIVHRDIAPDNMMVVDDNIEKTKLIDFGVASNTIGQDQSIIGDSFVGKFNYSAPEQLGLFGGKISRKSDLYALGLVLMKTLGLPLPGENQGAGAIEYRRSDIEMPAHVDPQIGTVLAALLKADPAERPDEAVSLFEAALKGEVAQTGTAQPTPSPAPSSRGSKTGLIAGGAAVLLAGAAAVYFLVLAPQEGGQDVAALAEPSEEAVSNALEEALAEATADVPAEPAAPKAAEAPPAPSVAPEVAKIQALISQGGEGNLNDALGALITSARNPDLSNEVKAQMQILLARMYDPKHHSTATSPFPTPNVNAALRAYETAADLGDRSVRADIARLKESQ